MGADNSSAQNDFLKALVISFDAISDFISKHGDEASRLAKLTGDKMRRVELLRMAESIDRITTG